MDKLTIEFEAQLKWRLNAFQDGLLGKTDIISVMAGMVRKQIRKAKIEENEYWMTKLYSPQRSSKGIDRQEFFYRIMKLKKLKQSIGVKQNA